MWHLFKNNDGKFEIAFISKGRYIVGSRQGYERKGSCLSALVQMGAPDVQDDTITVNHFGGSVPTVLTYMDGKYGRASFMSGKEYTTSKPYKPKVI